MRTITAVESASFWPHQTDGNPFTPVLDAAQKHVASTVTTTTGVIITTMRPGARTR